MNRLTLVIFFALISTLGKSQNKFPILLGMKDYEVREYFQKLINKSGNKTNLRINEEVSKEGNLIISLEFPMDEEDIFGGTLALTEFLRVDKVEICQYQLVVTTQKSANANISFIKDNFEATSSGVWTKIVFNGEFRIEAKFDRKDAMYGITYELYPVEIDK